MVRLDIHVPYVERRTLELKSHVQTLIFVADDYLVQLLTTLCRLL
jgi:hypothetical protein